MDLKRAELLNILLPQFSLVIVLTTSEPQDRSGGNEVPLTVREDQA